MTDDKTKASGIGRLLLGFGVALIGGLFAGKSSGPKTDGAGQGSDTDSANAAADAPSAGTQPLDATRPPEADGPSGPTAHPQGAPTGTEGHAVPDLAPGQPIDAAHRAPSAFRPDIDAPMTPAEREALRPATGPSPSLVSDEGAGVQGPGGDLT